MTETPAEAYFQVNKFALGGVVSTRFLCYDSLTINRNTHMYECGSREDAIKKSVRWFMGGGKNRDANADV